MESSSSRIQSHPREHPFTHVQKDGVVDPEQVQDDALLNERCRSHSKRMRTTLSWDSLSDFTVFPISPKSAIKRVLSDVGLCITLAWKLWGYLGVGYKWSMALYQLMLYATLLLPGFIQMIFFYFFSPRVIRSVPYGRGPRQRLDLYLPDGYSKEHSYPVCIFVTGGAWTIGYKAWGALFSRRLSAEGVLVACLDYRNFPQGGALQMLEDVNTGIAWVLEKCGRYGGDPDNVTLVGQSAGGQLSMLAMLKQAEAASGRGNVWGAWPSWQPQDLRAFVGVSGAFDLEGLKQHLHKRGLYKNMFEQIMSLDGVPALDKLSPLAVARTFVAPHKHKQDPESDYAHSFGIPAHEGNAKGLGAVHHTSSSSSDLTCSSTTDTAGCSDDCDENVCQRVQVEKDYESPTDKHARATMARTGYEVGAHSLHHPPRPYPQRDQEARHAGDAVPSPGAFMPPVILLHGTGDNSVPHSSSTQLHDALEQAGVDTTCRLVEGKSHTSFLLEGPMAGGRDILMDLLMPLITGKKDFPVSYPPLCPAVLCWLAGKACPF